MNTNTLERVRVKFVPTVEELRAHSAMRTVANVAMGSLPEVTVHATHGYHLYIRLRLSLDLEAADGDSEVRLFLKIIEKYARLAVELVEGGKATLLELQGETLHLFYPADVVTDQSLRKIFAYAVAFRDEVERLIGPLAGEAWKSLRFTLDHGPTLLLDSTRNVDDSIISLAPAANRPAKQFAKDSKAFPSDHLRLRAALVLPFSDFRELATKLSVYADEKWISLSIESIRSATTQRDEGARKIEELRTRISKGFERQDPDIALGNVRTLSLLNAADPGTTDKPSRLTGWVLRADLDGFSAGVAAAFAATNHVEALRELTARFLLAMEDATRFDEQCPWSFEQLPWAGDCASRIIACPAAGYGSAALELPAKVASLWHSKAGTKEWLVSIAGGDEEEGKGFILLAEMTIAGRTHRVSGGWAVRRSKQGEQDVGGSRRETVLHRRDAVRLRSPWREAFSDIDGIHRFVRATERSLEQARQKSIAARAPVTVPAILAPRPYAR